MLTASNALEIQRTAIEALERAWIDLEYVTADCSYRKISAADYLERSDMETLLRRLVAAKLAAQVALNCVLSPPDLKIPQAA